MKEKILKLFNENNFDLRLDGENSYHGLFPGPKLKSGSFNLDLLENSILVHVQFPNGSRGNKKFTGVS